MASTSRRPDDRPAHRIVLIVLLGLFTTGFSAPIEDLRREIRALKTEQATIAQREEALMARQDELARTIKRLKSETRGQAGPFGSRKLENALQQLRAVLDERELLERRRTELGVRIDEAFTRLRAAVRDEILHLVSQAPENPDPRAGEEIRALLTLYPPSPTLPVMPSDGEPWTPSTPTSPETLAEQTLLLRDQRERHEVLLRRTEAVYNLLSEEHTLYRTLAGRDPGFETHWQTVDRQVAEANSLIEALNDRMHRMDDALRHLDVLVSQPMDTP